MSRLHYTDPHSKRGRLTHAALMGFRRAILEGRLHLTDHAILRMWERQISLDDALGCIAYGAACSVPIQSGYVTGGYCDGAVFVVVGARCEPGVAFYSLTPSVVTVYSLDELEPAASLIVPLAELAELRV